MTSLVVRSDSEEAARPVLLVEYDAAAISKGADPAIVSKWVYDLPGTGQGVGVRGVEEASRLLASHGEVIRVDSVVIANQDDEEALFVATASRYVIGGDGVEVKLDTQVRGKRVPKWENHSDSYMREHRGAPLRYFNPNWFELGLVKAGRNAALALMPSNVKSAILRAGLDAIAQTKATGRRNEPAPPPRTAEAERPAPTGETREAEKFWERFTKANLQPAQVNKESRRRFGTDATKLPADQVDALYAFMTGEVARPPVTDCEHVAAIDERSGKLVCQRCGTVLEEGSSDAND